MFAWLHRYVALFSITHVPIQFIGAKFIIHRKIRSLGIMQDTKETEQFCIVFDRFFDMMNTRAIDEGLWRRKSDLKAYEKEDDSRFQVGILQL